MIEGHQVTAEEEALWVAALDKYEAEEKKKKADQTLAGDTLKPKLRDAEERFLASLDPSWLPPPGTDTTYLGDIFPGLARLQISRKRHVKPPPIRKENRIRFKKNKYNYHHTVKPLRDSMYARRAKAMAAKRAADRKTDKEKAEKKRQFREAVGREPVGKD